jgi:hypothetical protein
MSNAFDLDSVGSSDDTDAGAEFQSIKFAKELIETPPMSRGKMAMESDVPATVKRNLSTVSDEVAKGQCNFPLKNVRIENE